MQERAQDAWLDSPDVSRVAFHPRREAPAGVAAGFETLDIPVGDGVTVGARFYAAGTERPAILFFHGNGEIVADYHGVARFFVAAGANFLPVDYRGYGRSTGSPTVGAMLADARTVFAHVRRLLSERGFAATVIVMGRSLGSAPALEIAAAHPDETAGLVIDSGFADAVALMVRLGARRPAVSPAAATMGQERKIAAYGGSTLIVHGTADAIIPVADAEALFRASGSASKRLVKIDGAGHNDLLAVGMREYMRAVAELVGAVSGHAK